MGTRSHEGWSMRLVAVAIAASVASAIALVVPAPSDPPGPPIALADRTFPLQPPADPGDGSLVGGTLTPFDVQYSAVGRLDPALLSAVQGAATAAAADGIT